MSGERNLTSFHLMKSSHRDDFKSRDDHSAYYTLRGEEKYPPQAQERGVGGGEASAFR
jgi:hypothetical protein